MLAGSGSVSAGFGPPGTFPWPAGFLSGPPPALAGTFGPDWEKKKNLLTISDFEASEPCLYVTDVF